ncbi:MAG: biotin-dependent carboxyltransferase family protein, partial [Rhodanobacteraceae bacterium]
LGPFGGRPLRTGDVLKIGKTGGKRHAAKGTVTAPQWSIDARPWFDDDPAHALRLLPGTHLDNLTEISRKGLFSQYFIVDTDSNRVGLRLNGPRLEWTSPIEMVSEGCVPGLLQLPPSGQPIALGPESPVSGGYPRLGQIIAVDLPRLAQRRTGDAVRFRPCTSEEAWRALRERETGLRRLERRITARLQREYSTTTP